MALGSVNIPGIPAYEIKNEIENLVAAIMSGELTVPLSTDDGKTILTVNGEEILAYQNFGNAQMEQIAAMAVENVSERVDAIHKNYSKAIIAV